MQHELCVTPRSSLSSTSRAYVMPASPLVERTQRRIRTFLWSAIQASVSDPLVPSSIPVRLNGRRTWQQVATPAVRAGFRLFGGPFARAPPQRTVKRSGWSPGWHQRGLPVSPHVLELPEPGALIPRVTCHCLAGTILYRDAGT